MTIRSSTAASRLAAAAAVMAEYSEFGGHIALMTVMGEYYQYLGTVKPA